MTRAQHSNETNRPLLTGIAIVLAVTLVAFVLTRGEEKAEGLTIHASFADASPLLPGNDVRMNGVNVGIISDISLADEGAELTMDLDPEALPIYQDARATIRPVTLLGERYIELSPGTETAGAMADGGRIPATATGATTDLDQVLNSLDDPTSAALAALVGTLGDGLDQNGVNVDDAIKALAPALTDTNALAMVLRDHNTTLDHLVTTMEGVAAEIATDEGAALDRLVGSADKVLATTASNEVALRAVIKELPATIATARRTLGRLEAAANSAAPTLAKLRPTARQLPEVSAELLDFVDSADPALKSANPVLEEALSLLKEAGPAAALLRDAGPALVADAKNLDTITEELTADLTPVFEFIRGWALTTNGKDGLSHYFRANLVLTTGMVTGITGDLLDGPKVRVPGGKNAPELDLGGLLPDLGVDKLLDSLGLSDLLVPQTSGSGSKGGLLDGLLSPRTAKDGGVTGLTRQQESGALGFLMGGGN